jgi:hypothetical protein
MRIVATVLISLMAIYLIASYSANSQEDDTEEKITCECKGCEETPLIKTQRDAETVGRALFTVTYGEKTLEEVGGVLAFYVERKKRGAYWVVGGKRKTREGGILTISFDHKTGCFLGAFAE